MTPSPLPSTASPSEVFAEIQRRLCDEDYRGAVEFFSPRLLESLAGHAVPSATTGAREGLTPEAYQEGDPDMPRPVAEYMAARAARSLREQGGFDTLVELPSEEELKEMSAPDRTAWYLKASDHRRLWRRYVDALLAHHPEHREALRERRESMPSPWSGEVAGDVVLGGRAWVIWGIQAEDDPARRFEIAPRVAVLVRDEEGWRLASDLAPGYGIFLGPVEVPDGKGGVIRLRLPASESPGG